MNTILERIWEQKATFFLVFFLVFSMTYIVLMAVDFLPEAPAGVSREVESESTSDSAVSQAEDILPEDAALPVTDAANNPRPDEFELAVAVVDEQALPVSMYIPKLERSITVLNPTSRLIADLDAALLNGVVRHPDSATLTQEGTVFILGHSSYLPVVLNKNFQAFNGIQNLAWGDIIEVTSEEAVYEYRVEKVYRASAQDVTVPIAGSGHTLVIATCNSFGSVDDRYIVEASRIAVRAL